MTIASITFILPVLNRGQVIERAIRSCLACTSSVITPRVLVIDGGSTDDTFSIVQNLSAIDSRVELLSQPKDRPGFMNACYFGVEQVTSEFVTFMYSDDILSPYFLKMVEVMSEFPETDIAFGYGKQTDENEVIDFYPFKQTNAVESANVLRAYYGKYDALDSRLLPLSPICCVVKMPLLKKWVVNLQAFVDESPLRYYSMIKLAGGPDLMIYLTALREGDGHVRRTEAFVAQFTRSDDSISNKGNREMQLQVGYWLARLYCLTRIAQARQTDLFSELSGPLAADGISIQVKKLLYGDWKWSLFLLKEIAFIFVLSCRQHKLWNTCSGAVVHLLGKFQRKILRVVVPE